MKTLLGCILFVGGCVPTRLALAVWLLRQRGTGYSPMWGPLAVVLAMVGTAFWILYQRRWRLTGPEVFGGRIWWHTYRPLHAACFLLASVALWQGYPRSAGCWLLVDVSLGLGLSMVHHHG